ncbi:MAG: trigger factor [Pirellulales bacterium]|nr:trigger factor [Pirellulales bacterium]
MADSENTELDESLLDSDETAAEGEEQPQRLELEVKIENRGTCERHITVTVPREDIERYYDKEFSDIMPEAQIPGFRPGRAPRKLVESRFRKEVAGKVKSQLLMDSLGQIHEEQQISAISEPDLDLDAVEMPDQGPMTFEFNLEVRPEFNVPKWKGLKIEKPVHEITAADVDDTLRRILEKRGKLAPFDGPAEPGDYVTVNLTFKDGDRVLSSANEEVIRLRPVLSFRDGKIEQFDKLMAGVRAGESRTAETEVSADAPTFDLRGKTVTAVFEVLEVKKLKLPELNAELLDELGGFQLEADLRDAIEDQLARKLDYERHQRARAQITAALTEAATWELPPKMLERQSHRELERAVMEYRRSGFTDDEIDAHANDLRQNSYVSTAKALKEHFILERIAEDEKIDIEERDYDAEIKLIAAQLGESARRVRSKLEKAGNMDVLRNQIVERKVVDLILAHASFKEVPFEFETTVAEAIDQALSGPTHGDIPEAKPEPQREELKPGYERS